MTGRPPWRVDKIQFKYEKPPAEAGQGHAEYSRALMKSPDGL
jgi:hypothetical protein